MCIYACAYTHVHIRMCIYTCRTGNILNCNLHGRICVMQWVQGIEQLTAMSPPLYVPDVTAEQ